MKSLDEIKKGLECCSISYADCNNECPYKSDCDGSQILKDALALIQQLEAEQDALMHYLHSMGCDTCLYDDYDGSEPPCINCTLTRDLWQFQGVQKEESNA